MSSTFYKNAGEKQDTHAAEATQFTPDTFTLAIITN